MNGLQNKCALYFLRSSILYKVTLQFLLHVSHLHAYTIKVYTCKITKLIKFLQAV